MLDTAEKRLFPTRGTSGAEPLRRSRLRRFSLILGATASALLIGFHAILFFERVRDLSILDPRVAVQWAAAALLLAFLGYLKWRGVPLLHGRPALAVWLLVLLLHLVPSVPSTTAYEHTDLLVALPTIWLTMVTILVALVVLGVTLRPRPAVASRRRRAPDRGLSTRDGFAIALYARPPPPVTLH